MKNKFNKRKSWNKRKNLGRGTFNSVKKNFKKHLILLFFLIRINLAKETFAIDYNDANRVAEEATAFYLLEIDPFFDDSNKEKTGAQEKTEIDVIEDKKGNKTVIKKIATKCGRRDLIVENSLPGHNFSKKVYLKDSRSGKQVSIETLHSVDLEGNLTTTTITKDELSNQSVTVERFVFGSNPKHTMEIHMREGGTGKELKKEIKLGVDKEEGDKT